MTDPAEPPQDKKLFVDEGWKAQVEAEREALKGRDEKKAAQGSAAGTEEDRPLPPPTLADLASSLAMQAMIAMGLLANPLSGKAEVRPHHARHLIDTLGLLQRKTEGNRTAEETEAFDHLLHELRLGFLAVQTQ
jgi:hypothetical protein